MVAFDGSNETRHRRRADRIRGDAHALPSGRRGNTCPLKPQHPFGFLRLWRFSSRGGTITTTATWCFVRNWLDQDLSPLGTYRPQHPGLLAMRRSGIVTTETITTLHDATLVGRGLRPLLCLATGPRPKLGDPFLHPLSCSRKRSLRARKARRDGATRRWRNRFEFKFARWAAGRAVPKAGGASPGGEPGKPVEARAGQPNQIDSVLQQTWLIGRRAKPE